MGELNSTQKVGIDRMHTVNFCLLDYYYYYYYLRRIWCAFVLVKFVCLSSAHELLVISILCASSLKLVRFLQERVMRFTVIAVFHMCIYGTHFSVHPYACTLFYTVTIKIPSESLGFAARTAKLVECFPGVISSVFLHTRRTT